MMVATQGSSDSYSSGVVNDTEMVAPEKAHPTAAATEAVVPSVAAALHHGVHSHLLKVENDEAAFLGQLCRLSSSCLPPSPAARAEHVAMTHRAAGFSGIAAACAFLIADCLGSLSLLVDFAAKYPVAVAAAGSALLYIAPQLRAFREQRNVHGRTARAECAATTRHAAHSIGLPLAAVCALVVATPSDARGGLDALRLSPRRRCARIRRPHRAPPSLRRRAPAGVGRERGGGGKR
ncbi:unnamed protein product [Urochloa humidicola]